MGAKLKQWIASLSSNLCVAIAGSGFAWMTPLMVRLVSENSPVPMTTNDSSWLSSSIQIGQLAITMPVSLLADKFGRKYVILSTGPLSLIAWFIIITTRSIFMLYVVRTLQGIVAAIAFTVVPLYLAEISEAGLRGVLCGQLKVLWYIGTLYDYLTGPFLSYDHYAIVCAVLPVVFLALFAIMPESPYYLIMKGRNIEACESLKWLRDGRSNFEVEFKGIQHSIEEDLKRKATWKDLFATRRDVYVFLLVQIVCLTKMLNGLSAILVYATQTFSEEFSETLDSKSLTIIFGVVLLLTSFCSSFLTDRVGRRPLLIFSSAASALCHAVTTVICYLDKETDVDVANIKWISWVTIIAFCITCNVGLGPLLTTIQAEYFPSHTRSLGSGLTEVVAAIAGFISIKQYQVINDIYGVYMNFFIFCIISIIGTIILIKVLPETAGKTLGQIQEDFHAKTEETRI